MLDQGVCRKLLLIPATVNMLAELPKDLTSVRDGGISGVLKQIEERNARFFDEEVLKLDRWSEDLKQGLEREIKERDKAKMLLTRRNNHDPKYHRSDGGDRGIL